jgi:serine/threonine-protein kinase
MEFVEGMDLKQWLEKHGAPPLEMALLMLSSIARGIEHAHQHRIVHRDIKPANVMFTPEGVLKIMDFGLARHGEDSTRVTQVGSVLGTPAYMSPEQATGENVDERTDIFSTGVVGYELLGAQRPFGGDSYSSVIHAILTIDAPPLESVNPLVSDDVLSVVHRMLEKDASKRYQKMAEARGDLDTIVERMGLHRSRDLLQEYARDPDGVKGVLDKKRLSKHLDQGLYYETLGLGKIDDALREFSRVLHLEPKNDVAREHLQKLQQERKKMAEAEAEVAADRTLVMTPDAAEAIAHGDAGAAAEAPGAMPATATDATSISTPPVAPAPPAKPGGKRNLLIAAAGALVVIMALVGVMILISPGDSGRPESPVETGPPAETATPPTAADVPPTEQGTSGAETVTPPAVPQTGSLKLDSNPAGATVFIDGERQPQRSNTVFEGVGAGTHRVRVQRSGYRAQEKRVTVSAGEQATLAFSLEKLPPRTGTLEIKAQPFASYYVNGKLEASNVARTTVTVPAGKHEVRIVHPAFDPHVWSSVDVAGGQTTTLEYSFLAQTPGNLRVTSGGIWAKVFLDGKDTGKTTPCVLEGLSPGSHRVRLARAGFTVDGGERVVEVKGGETGQVDFTLKADN